MPDIGRINNTMGKMVYYLSNHENILVSVSGGSDSDIIVHIIATYLREFLPKIHFVNVNIGLEYQATKDHLKYLEAKYNISIESIRGKSVVWAVKHYWVPVLSKEHSQIIHGYCNGAAWAVQRFNGEKKGKLFTPRFKVLLEQIKLRNMRVSDKCCDVSKKKPLFDYIRAHHIDLQMTGERQAEGGLRSMKHTNCFEPGNHGIDKYMPLFFWDDETKAYYKETEGIRYSDCYEVWGMKRTGCVGCPYNSKIAQDLRMIEKYEPRLAEACKNVFGESYRLTDELWCRKDKVFPTETQLSLFDNTEDD